MHIITKTAQQELYRTQARIDLDYPSNLNIENYTKQVLVTYSIEAEGRSWGWKTIYVAMQGTANISIEIENLDQNLYNHPQVKEIQVDLSQLKHEKVAGDGVYVSQLNIAINPDFSVNYDRSVAEIVGAD